MRGDTPEQGSCAWCGTPMLAEAEFPPMVRTAIAILLRHVEPGWDNCTTLVQAWLDGKLDTSRSATAESSGDPQSPVENAVDARRYRKLRAEMCRGDVPMDYLPTNLHGIVGQDAFDRAVDEGWK